MSMVVDYRVDSHLGLPMMMHTDYSAVDLLDLLSSRDGVNSVGIRSIRSHDTRTTRSKFLQDDPLPL